MGRRDGAAFLTIQDSGCSAPIDLMLERWVPVHSLERRTYEMHRPKDPRDWDIFWDFLRFVGFLLGFCPPKE